MEDSQSMKKNSNSSRGSSVCLDPDAGGAAAAFADSKENTLKTANKILVNSSSRKSQDSPRKTLPGSPNKPPRGAGKQQPWRAASAKGQSPQFTAKSQAPNAPPNSQPLLKKLTKSTPQRALDYALQAVRFFDEDVSGRDEDDARREIELTMSLHALAAVYCRLGQFNEALSVLERSLKVPHVERGTEHALAVFSGHMHLGDTYGLMGRQVESLQSYHKALDLQKKAVGDRDFRVAQTYRYLAEAHLQNMQFKEAEEMCEQLLNLHAQIGTPGSVEEAADRRLMALICSGKGEHDLALEYLVLASMSLISHGRDLEVAASEVSIGDTYVALGRYEDAVFAYQKALTVFKSAKGEDHVSVASVYVSLADLYLKTGKQREARTYCETALKLYAKHESKHTFEDMASGLMEISALYGALNDPERALQLMSKVLDMVEANPGQQNAIAPIEAQMGVLYYVLGKYGEALVTFKSAVMKLKATSGGPGTESENKTAFIGMVLNQMGLACVELYEIGDAAQCFQEAKSMLEQAYGADHVDTIAVSTNLAATYDALGRLDEAISLLQKIIKSKESLKAEDTEADIEKKMLNELLKETGQSK